MFRTPDIFIGLMSGTSLDGVDIAIVDFSTFPPTTLHTDTVAYPAALRQRLQNITRAGTASLDELCRLDREVATFYADVVRLSLRQSHTTHESVSAIGCHGQTLRHSPVTEPTYTLQIGDPNTLAADTGIPTVSDFRRRDIALGGQGAPLAPAFHRFLFHSPGEDRVIINIGGIANLTYLPGDRDSDVLGFDTGPGNTLLDAWANRHLEASFDARGDWGASGQVIEELLQAMLGREPYFKRQKPKSTGTEYFNPDWLAPFLKKTYLPADIQATLTELTARTIANGVETLPGRPACCYVCGGGIHNRFLMDRLQSRLEAIPLGSTGDLGLDPDYVEASAFAWLARQTLMQQPGNLPSVTHARRAAILGGIYAGNPDPACES